MAKRKGGLGRGLDALFADATAIVPDENEKNTAAAAEQGVKTAASKAATKKSANGSSAAETTTRGAGAGENAERVNAAQDAVIYIDINDIKPNGDQPRKVFDEKKLEELASSITANGVIQPLIVRPMGDYYELVAGERRWRAARLALLKVVPCIVREFNDEENMIVAIIENMQREDLNPMEEALGIKKMADKYAFTQEQISKALGKSRAYIANSMRLLKLPAYIQDYVSDGRISAAHARTLITVSDEKKQKLLCDRIVKEGLSVRTTEQLAEQAKNEIKPERKKKVKKSKSPELRFAEEELRRSLGTKVQLKGTRNTGRIEIEYYSLEELNRLIELLRAH